MTTLTATSTGTTSPFSGTRILSDGQALSAAMKNGDWLDGGIAFLQGLGDAAAAMTDPIGTIVNCGLGWVMSHLGPLKTWLTQLAGSQEAVQSVAGLWTSAGSTMRNAGVTLANRLKDLDGLQGQTVTAYVSFAKDAATHISASGDWADAVASGFTNASQLVAKMQSVVKQAISSVIATAIEALAVVAATWGLGFWYAVARVVQKVNEVVNKVAKPILQVLQSVKSLVGMVQQFHQLFDGTNQTVSAMLNSQPAIVPLDSEQVIDASGATFLGNTAALDLQTAGVTADGRIHDLTVDGPIASGQLHLADFSGMGAGHTGAAVTGSGSAAGAVGLSGAGGLGATDAVRTGAVAGGMLGGTALSAAKTGGVGTAPGESGGGSQLAAGRTAPAEGMGSRSQRRSRRLTIDIVPDEDE